MWLFSLVTIYTLLQTDAYEAICTIVERGKMIVRYVDAAMIADYVTLRARLLASRYLESGLLISHDKRYELVYYNGVHRFRVTFPKKRGPKRVVAVVDQTGNDVTHAIFEYMGPSHNFHGIPTSPALLGYEALAFNIRNGAVLRFCGEELIELP